ncbi:hypothetical protein SAMN05421837_107369 [Amycolatopsis pretoriensis]|uniref:Uncharacterized protein n=1 Tax=Amycolatopsis pretoriensis TaxID=218821 RepID=A0A1H5RA50_9PSEU|nr:hypothetical protein [Amycolatopsis pretoriensis]SEF34398.1 hypothetical protein SAMN05421837_107369 [Amycolatopsis pretoriensis]
MATQQAITLNESNDENVKLIITTNVPTAGTALDLTGMSLEAFVKPTRATADSDGAVWKGTTTGGQVVITDAANGKATVSIPGSALTTTQTWWRVDVLSGGLRKTAIYGALTVTDL